MGDGGAGGTYVLAPVLLVLVLLVLLALALGLMLFVLWLVVALVAKANKRAAGCPKEKNSLASVLKKLLLYAHAHAPNAFEGSNMSHLCPRLQEGRQRLLPNHTLTLHLAGTI